jgi:hypothetical protein
MPSNLNGNHVLYHYLEKDLKEADIWLFQMLAARLFTALGVWFSRTLYASCPVLLPFAVRDPTCRPRKKGECDQRGSPNRNGYFRDDNSLIKALPRTLQISSPKNPIYNGRRLGNGFVACHVWRVKADGTQELSSRDPDTYSFVPNLVWLPAQVAKLTDREGSFAQAYLQALAYKIYRDVDVNSGFGPMVERAWEKLSLPKGIPDNGLPTDENLAFFEETGKYVERRLCVIRTVAAAIQDVVAGRMIRTKIVSSRYTEGLPKLSRLEVEELAEALTAIV